MPIFGENQVRQVYVYEYDATVASPITLKKAFDRAYFTYNGPDGKGGTSTITTDKIEKGHITDIRITKPEAPPLKLWYILAPTELDGSTTTSKDYVAYLHLKNWVGFGEHDQYEKFATVHAPAGMTATQFDSALKEQLEKQFETEAYKPFTFSLGKSYTDANKFKAVSPVFTALSLAYSGTAGVTISGTTITVTFSTAATSTTVGDLITALDGYNIVVTPNGTGTAATTFAATDTGGTLNTDEGVVIKENNDVITKNDIVMGRFRLPIEMTIGADWASNADAKGLIHGTAYQTITNGAIIAAMEYFFLRGRADRYGLNGGACNANPSEFVADPTADYYVLDIKYSYTDSGVHSYKSNKEMTIACTSATIANAKTALENLVYASGSGIISSTTGTTLSGGRDCEIYTVSF